MPKIRVLIVDDAVVVRRILTDALTADPEIEVATAANGRIALAKIPQINPDVVTLDMEMPELDGLGTLRELRKGHPKLPVIMFSTLTERGAGATLDALAAGANDYVTKPANVGSVGVALARVRAELIPKLKALCGKTAPAPVSAAARPLPARTGETRPPQPGIGLRGAVDVVAIGVSTGGPNALSEMIPALPKDLPVPVLIVQHMPPIFTKFLAERIRAQCPFPVVEGVHGMSVRPGNVIIAPGALHMCVERRSNEIVIATNEDPPENSCRPAVDVLFRSVAAAYGSRALAVVLTGMGSDGLRGCEHICEAGGQVIVQDEASSVVWGMPGYVARAGLAQKQVPLREMAGEVARRLQVGARVCAPALA